MAPTPTEPILLQAQGLPGQQLDAAIAAARIAAPLVTGPDKRDYAFIPEGFSLKELEDRAALPPRPRQSVTVDDRASLSAYANRHKSKSSIIIADYDALQISARLDWHPHNEEATFGASGADGHNVTLKIRPSEEFARWDKMEGEFHPQAEFARFLEENAVDVEMPDAATMIELSKDFEAQSGSVYKSSVRLQNGDRALRYETETKALSDVVIPNIFTLRIPLYLGEEPMQLTARFRWRAQNGMILLGFEWHRVEYIRQAHFREIATQAAEETGLPVYIGRRG